ncbi:MAG: hypothetical protein IJN24_08630 [Bacteroidaceae bacterium]|nr:hypothetical protein [Bacteroidaceae bacterium]
MGATASARTKAKDVLAKQQRSCAISTPLAYSHQTLIKAMLPHSTLTGRAV